MADVELPLTGHLAELRSRLGRGLLAVVVAFAACYPSSKLAFDFLTAPLLAANASSPVHAELIGTGVAEAFFTRLKVSFVAALFLALPVILYQTWLFVVPALKAHEARYAKSFVAAGTVFFFAGSAFCYTVVFPFGFPFFLSEYHSIGVEPAIRISEYLSFSSRMLLAFGIIFELPVATFFLARMGLVTHRMLIHFARYAVVAVFVLAAILTPPDVATQLLMAVPLLLLYGLSVGVAWTFGKPRPKLDDDED
jgi:sec-independent protein translocase protein TatC